MVVTELRQKYKLTALLKLAEMPRSTYYYWLKQLKKEDKYTEIKKQIKLIFDENKGLYGYRRITDELRNRGFKVNHKTVFRLMKILGLKSIVRPKRRYSSYKGEVGKIADNLLKRDFNSEKPNEKWATDVTEFKVCNEKLYFSPIIDLFNGEVVSYNLSRHPNFQQIRDMLNKAFEKTEKKEGKERNFKKEKLLHPTAMVQAVCSLNFDTSRQPKSYRRGDQMFRRAVLFPD